MDQLSHVISEEGRKNTMEQFIFELRVAFFLQQLEQIIECKNLKKIISGIIYKRHSYLRKFQI